MSGYTQLNPANYIPVTFAPNTAQCTLTRFGGWMLRDGTHGCINMEVKTLTSDTGSIGTLSIHPSMEIACAVCEFTGSNPSWNYGWIRTNGTIALSASKAMPRCFVFAVW